MVDLSRAHRAGLDVRYDDVIGFEDLESGMAGDREAFEAAGPAYHYGEQRWMDCNDHAHMASADSGLPLLFCGADLRTCCGVRS